MTRFELYIGEPQKEEKQTITITLKEWNEKNTLASDLKKQNTLLLKGKSNLWEITKKLVEHIDDKEVQNLVKLE